MELHVGDWMKMVFLRGAVPPAHEHPEKLLYDGIGDCEDMWTQLFCFLMRRMSASGELVYQGGNREKLLDDGAFIERWVPSVPEYKPGFEPDIVICRGGFAYYDPFLRRFPSAFKVYYGAGARFFPTSGFKDYRLFLVDSPYQLEELKRRNVTAELFVKPAASMFEPKPVGKRWDVCFMANAAQGAIKGHEWFLRTMAGSGMSVLNIGNVSDEYFRLARKLGVDVTWGGWHPRRELPDLISRCRVGVACSLSKDSCPRVIPEYLACGIPVVVTDDVRFWSERYVTEKTGIVTPRDGFVDSLRRVLANQDGFRPREHYDRALSLPVSVEYLASLLENWNVRV